MCVDNIIMGNSVQSPKIIQPIIKKALLIGINYTGTNNELNGCINDMDHLKQFLLENKYFAESELISMNDFQKDCLYPNKANMITQFGELVKFANANQDKSVYLFLSYSGHGSYVKDLNGDETDEQDEVLCPIDCDQNGFIVDDDIKSIVDKLGTNVTLVVLIDACHSGTILDLKYNYTCDTKNTYTVRGKSKDTRCKVIMMSGCRDNQTSADAYLPDGQSKTNEYQGAMTAAFIANYYDEISVKKLIKNMRAWLSSNHYAQVPQLSSGRFLDVSAPFLLSIFNN